MGRLRSLPGSLRDAWSEPPLDEGVVVGASGLGIVVSGFNVVNVNG